MDQNSINQQIKHSMKDIISLRLKLGKLTRGLEEQGVEGVEPVLLQAFTAILVMTQNCIDDAMMHITTGGDGSPDLVEFLKSSRLQKEVPSETLEDDDTDDDVATGQEEPIPNERELIFSVINTPAHLRN